MIGIINYGSGNVRAIGNIYDKLNIAYKIVSQPLEIESVNKIILPGVGAFDETMTLLNESRLKTVLNEHVLVLKKPVLGICVGMQILADGSEEGVLDGLGWIKGRVRLFDGNKIPDKPKIPHLGWNSILQKKKSPLFNNVNDDLGFYFIHSYYFECNNNEDVLTETYYGEEFVSSVNNANIFGTQFHPEKSHSNGINLLENFANL